MPELTVFASALHALGAVIWVGGMFFAHQVLRPSLGAFEPPQRLTLWNAVFKRFFTLVWIIVIAIPATGYWQVYTDFGSLEESGHHVYTMNITGLIMIGLFIFLYAVPYQKFKAAVEAEQWPVAGGHLNMIRRIVGINTILGLITVVIGASGRFWG
jgi:uncharacterized membrane protein